MPRWPQIKLPGVPVHLIQRGNNRQACFYHDEDYRFYLEWLEEYARESACSVHSYVLMTNHVHILLTSDKAGSVGELMKRLGQRYVQYINRTYKRSGTLWEGRFRSCLTQEEDYVLSCYRYIELNPVRAGMVEHPAEYRWSSYRSNAQNEPSSLLSPHLVYELLGHDSEKQLFYRSLFSHHLEPGLVVQIRSATNGNYALGNNQFEEMVSIQASQRVTRGKPGRPTKMIKAVKAGSKIVPD